MTSLYDISVPVLANVLTTTTSILKKGEAWAAENKTTAEELLDLRVYEDMMALKVQVLIIVMSTRKAVERLTGVPAVVTTDDASGAGWDLPKLYALLEAAQKELTAVDKAQVDAKPATDKVPLKFGPDNFECPSPASYVHGYAVPTVYFHLNMIYALLRGKGVPLGKTDYLDAFTKDFVKQ